MRVTRSGIAWRSGCLPPLSLTGCDDVEAHISGERTFIVDLDQSCMIALEHPHIAPPLPSA